MFGGTIQYFENEGKPFRGFMSLQGTFISLDQTVATRALCLEVTDGLTESLVLCAPPLRAPRPPGSTRAANARRSQAPTRTDMDEWFNAIRDHIQTSGFTTLPSDDKPLYCACRGVPPGARPLRPSPPAPHPARR